MHSRNSLSALKKARPLDEVAIAGTQVAVDVAPLREKPPQRNQGIEDAVYDLKAVNPNKKSDLDTRTPVELLDFIELKGKEIAGTLAELAQLSQEGIKR